MMRRGRQPAEAGGGLRDQTDRRMRTGAAGERSAWCAAALRGSSWPMPWRASAI